MNKDMKKVFLKTFGCPLMQVPRDDFGDIEDGKCFGMIAV